MFVSILLGLVFLTGLLLILVFALWRHKNAGAGEVKLIGEIGRVGQDLDPEGTVMVQGELWRARSRSGNPIWAPELVRVIGFEGHLALVDVCD